MGTFDLTRCVPARVSTTFDVFSDFRQHGDFIPMTTMSCDDGPLGVNWRFVGRTGLGPLALVDRMEISVWNPPFEFRIDKLGPVLDGWAHVHFSREGAETRVVWREQITVRPHAFGQAVSPLVDPLNKLMFGRALDKMARRAVERD